MKKKRYLRPQVVVIEITQEEPLATSTPAVDVDSGESENPGSADSRVFSSNGEFPPIIEELILGLN